MTRSELSTSSEWFVPRHRYYELKHFCLQYSIWKEAYDSLTALGSTSKIDVFKHYGVSDPTSKVAEQALMFRDRMKIVEQSALEADPVIGPYIFQAVTEGISYDILKVQTNIPCCKDVYYDLYHKFFYILSKKRR